MVFNVTGYTLFVTSQYDVSLAKFVDTACIVFYTHSPFSLLQPAMFHCNTHMLISLPR